MGRLPKRLSLGIVVGCAGLGLPLGTRLTAPAWADASATEETEGTNQPIDAPLTSTSSAASSSESTPPASSPPAPAAEGLSSSAPPAGANGSNSSATDRSETVPPTTGPHAAGPLAAGEASGASRPESPDSDSREVSSDLLSREQLHERLQGVEKANLDASAREAATAAFRRAAEMAELLTQQRQQIARYAEEIERSPRRVKERREKLALPAVEAAPPAEDLPTAALQEGQLEREKGIAEKREKLNRFLSMQKQRATRLTAIPDEIAKAQRQLHEASASLAKIGDQESDNIVAIAQRQSLLYEEEYLQALQAALKAEEEYKTTGAEALQLIIDLNSRELAALEKEATLWRDAVNVRRQADAAKQAAQAAREAEVARAPALERCARENAELAKEAEQTAAKLASTMETLTSVKTQLEGLKKEFQDSRARIDAVGLTAESGKLLRRKQAGLPNVRQLKRRRDARRREESKVSLRAYELNVQRSDLADIDDAAMQLIRDAGSQSEPVEARQLLERQRTYLDSLNGLYLNYSIELSKLESTEADLIATSEEYADFIAQRVLWVRSCEAPHRAHWHAAIDAGAWLLNPLRWREAASSLLAVAQRRPALLGLLSCGLALVALVQRRARRLLAAEGELATKRTCIEFRPTLRALGLTALIAVPWPYLLLSVGSLLDTPLEESEFVRSLSTAFRLVAACLLLCEFLRQMCRRGGLADAHFAWPNLCLVQLRRHARWLNALALPLVALVAGMETQSGANDMANLRSSSLGRLAFVALMGLLTAFLYRLLLVDASPLRQLMVRSKSGGWLVHFQRLTRPLATLLPAALALLALGGYYYSAQQAALRILEAVFLLSGVAVLGGLVRRWLLVNQRAIAREHARQRRAQLMASQESEGAASGPSEAPDDAVDLAALSEQTLKIVRLFLEIVVVVGLLGIFGRLLPALAFVGAYSMWPGVIDLEWRRAILFTAAVAITYVASRDLPALVELTLLKLLSYDSGARYALSTLSRYALVTAGTLASGAALGIHWSQVQWLVAAMSVGLGFGLQEIFANFVSGVILLFERPIRMGDVVTLGDKTGVVNRIRIRATTLIDWDRKEFIIPNKDLVTGSLLNWTLSDHVNRIVIDVGVAYGTDTEQACRILREVACQHPQILRDPAPLASLKGFGDSSLNLALQCFLPTLDHRVDASHDLHTAILKRFAEEGIDIPFPQRDLHVRVSHSDHVKAAQHRNGETSVANRN